MLKYFQPYFTENKMSLDYENKYSLGQILKESKYVGKNFVKKKLQYKLPQKSL